MITEPLSPLSRVQRRYAASTYADLEAGSCRRHLERLGLDVHGKRVLEVGCGPGQHLLEMATDAPALAVGTDLVASWLPFVAEQAAARRLRGVALVGADAMALPFKDASFDVVECLLTLPYVADDAAALAELARVLTPGGVLVVSGHGLGFPLRYARKLRLRPLLLYPVTLVYRLLGKKPYRNTLQTNGTTCEQLRRAGVHVDQVQLVRGALNLVHVFTIRGTKPVRLSARAAPGPRPTCH